MMQPSELSDFLTQAFPQVASDFRIHPDGNGLSVELLVTDRHLRPGGTVSGPSLFCLADVAFYLAILQQLGPEALAVTTNAAITFLRRPAAENLTGCPRILKTGKGLVTGDVLIYAAGDRQRETPLAQAMMTYSRPRAGRTPSPNRK